MVFWVLSPWVHGILIATPLSPHYRSGVVDACGSSVNPRARTGHGVGLWQHGGHMRKESPLGLKELERGAKDEGGHCGLTEGLRQQEEPGELGMPPTHPLQLSGPLRPPSSGCLVYKQLHSCCSDFHWCFS